MRRVSLRVSLTGLVVVVAGAAQLGCPALAVFPVFSGLREDLIADCCFCLAENAVVAEGASCTPSTVDENGVLVLPADALTEADVEKNQNNDPDDDIDGVPCLCGGTEAICNTELAAGRTVPIPGACVDQATNIAPCEQACSGVLSFDGTTSQ